MTQDHASGTDLGDRLDARIAALDLDAIAGEIAAATGTDADESLGLLRMYIAEAPVALALVEPHLRPHQRILEIGSGIGFFAGFLADCGYDVVELEPVGDGFEFVGAARAALPSASAAPRHLPISVEDLDPEVHGRFDLVYSLNVLEHVPDWRVALDRTTGVMTAGGVMVQSCPNYTFPFDPHFGVPLIPGAPAATSRLLPDRITSTGLWKSLNWVTARSVRRWADDRDVEIVFREGKLADAIERLNVDPEFSRRHGRVGRVVASTARVLRLAEVVRAVPASLTSPMEFTVTLPVA